MQLEARGTRRRIPGALAGALIALWAAPAGTALAAPARRATPAEVRGAERREAIPGQYIVVFRQEATDAEIEQAAGMVRGRSRDRVDHRYRKALRGFSGALAPQTLEELRANPAVDYIEADSVVKMNLPWGLDRIDQKDLPLNNQYVVDDTGAGVNVYVIDTGIRITHQEFEGRAVHAFTSVNDGRGADDCAGHGTHVAGTVGGRSFGVARDVNLFSVRVLDCAGSGTISGVIAGVDFVTANHVKPAVANMSLGARDASNQATSLDAAVNASIQAGVTYSISAGNDDDDACLYTPARVPAAITVGASRANDARASFSNFGSCVDIFAPGEDILSAFNTSDTATEVFDGTSMASPHVSGVAALVLGIGPADAPATVAQRIFSRAAVNRISGAGTGSANRLVNAPLPDALFVGDFDGDGRDDLLRYMTGVTGGDVCISNGADFIHDRSWTLASFGDDGWYVGDYDGDGRDDVFRYRAGFSGAEMFLSDGSRFVSDGSWTPASNGDDGWYVGDYNGDGKDDIFRYRSGISGAEVFLSNGSNAFVSAGSWTPAGHGSTGWHIGDYNGDGKDDIMRYIETGTFPRKSEVFLSNGSNAFVFAGNWTNLDDGTDAWYVGDFNGDGKDDIYRYEDGLYGANMFLSSGVSFVIDGTWTMAGNGFDRWRLGDFDGNGRKDIFRVSINLSRPDVFVSTGTQLNHLPGFDLLF